MREIVPLKQLKPLFLRGWLLYLLIALAVFTLVDLKKMSFHAKPSTLSRLRPDYNPLARFVDGRLPFNRKVFEDQIVYLQNVNAVMGERVDANILLAFCYAQLGEIGRAEKLFLRSIELNPMFFWNYYNLALISFGRGDADKAVGFLQTALKQDMELNMKFFLTSRVFLPLLTEGGYSPQKFYEDLRSGFADAYKLMVMIEFSHERFPEVAALAKMGAGYSSTDADRAFFAYFLGMAALRAGELSTAGMAFEECLKVDPGHPEALAGMGAVLEKAGRQELADGFVARARLARTKRGSGLPEPKDFKMRVF